MGQAGRHAAISLTHDWQLGNGFLSETIIFGSAFVYRLRALAMGGGVTLTSAMLLFVCLDI